MASFKYLIFFALAVLSVYSAAAESQQPTPEQLSAVGPQANAAAAAKEDENTRVKKHAYIAPVVAYSAPAVYPYAYSSYNSYPYSAYPVSAYSYSTYHGYPGYAYDDGKYWPGKYEKAYYPAYRTAYPGYPYYY